MVRVYDILNAGPRRRFTVSGKLVSNCFLEIYGGEEDKLFSVMAADRDKTTGKRTFPKLQPVDVEQWHERWHRYHPETKKWHQRCHAAQREFGWSGSPILDRRRRYFLGGVSKKNAVPNMTIQASAAALTNRATILLDEVIPHRGWSPYSGLVLQVHDFLGVIVPEERAQEAVKLFEKCMYFEVDGGLHGGGMTFEADVKVGRRWSEV